VAEFRYYMLRVRREPGAASAGAEALGGVVERLGSGEKHGFANAQELLHLLGSWTELASNMPSAAASRNDDTPEGLKEEDHDNA